MPLKRASRRTLVILFLAAVVMGGALALRQYAGRATPTLVSGPMVQIPRSDALTIVINLASEGTPPSASVRLQLPDGATETVEATPVGDGRYEATFERLTPGVEYEYELIGRVPVGSDVSLGGNYRTRLGHLSGKPLRFLCFGDSGGASNGQYDLGERMAGTDPDLIIHVGDLIYPSGALRDYEAKFFKPYAAMLHRIPFMPTIGNHDFATDRGEPMLDVFVLPKNGPDGIEKERNYFFDFGDARFVGLDTNLDTSGEPGSITSEAMKKTVAPWLRHVLTETDARWKFVYFHHPFYTGSTHAAEGSAYIKEAYVNVFEESGVDIVFCGHNHLYERTAPILKDAIVEEGRGIVYITSGAGGMSLYPELDTRPDYIRVFHDTSFSFTQVDLSPTRLALKQIDESGKMLDNFVMEKK